MFDEEKQLPTEDRHTCSPPDRARSRALDAARRDILALQQRVRAGVESQNAMIEQTRAAIADGWRLLREFSERFPDLDRSR